MASYAFMKLLRNEISTLSFPPSRPVSSLVLSLKLDCRAVFALSAEGGMRRTASLMKRRKTIYLQFKSLFAFDLRAIRPNGAEPSSVRRTSNEFKILFRFRRSE